MVRPRSGNKEQALMQAATALFLERGVRGTTVQQIAERANVAVGTVYVYYKDKTAIVRSVAYAFAERHHEFAVQTLKSRQRPLPKLVAYILGFYDMWQPFGENSQGAVELAEAVLAAAPETPGIAQAEFLGTVQQILSDAKKLGHNVAQPEREARWVALCTAAFFPLAGTPTVRPMSDALNRSDLDGLLQWLTSKLR